MAGDGRNAGTAALGRGGLGVVTTGPVAAGICALRAWPRERKTPPANSAMNPRPAANPHGRSVLATETRGFENRLNTSLYPDSRGPSAPLAPYICLVASVIGTTVRRELARGEASG